MRITGIILALFSAVAEASLNTVINTYKSKYSPIQMGFAQLLLICPVLLLFLFFINLPVFSLKLIFLLLLFGGLNVLGRTCYIKSIHLSGMSRTVPFLSFTPVFLIPIGMATLGQYPNIYGIAGIIFIVAGGYVIACNKAGESLRSIIKNIRADKGILFALATAFIWSLTTVVARMAMDLSDRYFFIIAALNIQFIIFFFLNLRQFGFTETLGIVAKDFRFFLISGLLLGAMEILIFSAYSMTVVAYANSMKRTNILFSVIAGYLIFKESGFRKNLLAAIIMVAGVILIMIFGK